MHTASKGRIVPLKTGREEGEIVNGEWLKWATDKTDHSHAACRLPEP